MRKFIPTVLTLSALFTVTFATAQGPEAEAIETSENYTSVAAKDMENRAIKALDPNGYMYEFKNLNINTPYSEHAMNQLVTEHQRAVSKRTKYDKAIVNRSFGL